VPNIPTPPSNVTGPVGDYLQLLWRTLQGMPNISAFSGVSPNSAVTGLPGDLAVNVGSASADSRLFVKGGASRQPSQTGWVTVRIA
jgi:hypothetical protein